MHELCLRKAEEERFLQYPNSSSKPIFYGHQYRLCIYEVVMLRSWFPWSNPAGPNICSLLLPPSKDVLLYPYETTSAFFMRLKFVRVLDLGSLDFNHCFPEEIVLLICLRYVSIRCKVEVIPPSIGDLCYLEILHLIREQSKEINFPHTVWRMKRLKIADVGPGAIVSLDDYETKVCPQLCDLHSFSSLRLCNIEDAEKILRGFPNVRKLKLELSKSWDCEGNCCDRLLHVLKNSLSKLESLSLESCKKKNYTCGLNYPEALKSLTLSGFFLRGSDLSKIGKLPNLVVLKLLDSAIDGEIWDVEDDEFEKLKYLKLSDIYISSWEAATSSFPVLERLVLRDCHFLKELPSSFAEIPYLRIIEARGCQHCLTTSAESIQRVQLEMGNEEPKVLTSLVHVSEDYPFSTCMLSYIKPHEFNRLTGLFKRQDFNILSGLFSRRDFDIILGGLISQPGDFTPYFPSRDQFNLLAGCDNDHHFDRLIRLVDVIYYRLRIKDHLWNELTNWGWNEFIRWDWSELPIWDQDYDWNGFTNLDRYWYWKRLSRRIDRNYFGILLSKYESDDFQIQKSQDLDGKGVTSNRFKRYAPRDDSGTNLLMRKYNCQPRHS